MSGFDFNWRFCWTKRGFFFFFRGRRRGEPSFPCLYLWGKAWRKKGGKIIWGWPKVIFYGGFWFFLPKVGGLFNPLNYWTGVFSFPGFLTFRARLLLLGFCSFFKRSLLEFEFFFFSDLIFQKNYKGPQLIYDYWKTCRGFVSFFSVLGLVPSWVREFSASQGLLGDFFFHWAVL